MSRAVVLYFHVVVLAHLQIRLSLFPYASVDYVEARLLLCGSAPTVRTTLEPCVSPLQKPSLFVLKGNHLFLSRLLYRSTESDYSTVTSSKPGCVISTRSSITKWTTATIYSERAECRHCSIPVKRCLQSSVFRDEWPTRCPTFLSDRFRCAMCPWVTPGATVNNLNQRCPTSAVSVHAVNYSTLDLSSRNLSGVVDSKINGANALRASTRERCSLSPRLPGICLPVLSFSLRDFSSLNRSTNGLSPALTSTTSELLRIPVSMTNTASPTATILSAQRSFDLLSCPVERLYCVFIALPRELLPPRRSSSGTSTQVVRIQVPPLQNTSLSCCSRTAPRSSTTSLHSPCSSYPATSSASRCCCWLLHRASPRLSMSESFCFRHLTTFRLPPFGDAVVSRGRTKNDGLAEVNGVSCRELLRAVALLPGITRSDSSKNAEIPEFLLPPLFTAVEAADRHHAQSIVAFWKKPGVPRVGWSEDMIEMVQEQQRSAARKSNIRTSECTERDTAVELRDGDRRQRIYTEDSPRRSAPSLLSATNGVADQGEALLIMTGSSPTHLDTLGEAIVEAMWEKCMRQVLGRDGRGFSGWVALSFLDLEVHIMTPVTRERYALEELYSLCPKIDISDAIKVDKLEGFEFMSGGIEQLKPGGPPFDPEVDADYGLYE